MAEEQVVLLALDDVHAQERGRLLDGKVAFRHFESVQVKPVRRALELVVVVTAGRVVVVVGPAFNVSLSKFKL